VNASHAADPADNALAEQQAHRARYDALRAAGQGDTARALPPPTPRGLPLPAPALDTETIPGGWSWTTRLPRGQALRVCTPSGTSCVSLMAFSVADPSERLNLADTVKVQWSVRLGKGRVIYTDMGRVALALIEDSCGAHDAIVGPTTQASMAQALGPGAWRHSRHNFLTAAAKLGLSRRDVAVCLNLFAPVDVDPQGRFTWHPERRSAGDFVDLRAEMDLWVVLSNAGHPLDPALVPLPEPVTVTRFAPPPRADDPCRRSGVEAERAYAYTARYLGEGAAA
jgi:urea carboxylase-associated protein 2